MIHSLSNRANQRKGKLNTYLDNIRAITSDDIMRVSNTYFNEKNLTIAVQFPEIIENSIPNE